MALHPKQSFAIERLPRSALKKAKYNPRTLSAESKRKLNASLDGFGLVEPIVWNKRTGNLVGGHQRLGELDALSESGKNYELDVSVIDVDIAAERRLNLVLNNAESQGYWDAQALSAMLSEAELDGDDVSSLIVDAGFDGASISAIIDDPRWASICSEDLQGSAARELEASIDGVMQERDEIREDVAANRQLTRDMKAGMSKKSEDHIAVIVFDDEASLAEFMIKIGAPPHSTYIQSSRVMAALKE